MAMAQRHAQAYALAQGLQVNTGTIVTHARLCARRGTSRPVRVLFDGDRRPPLPLAQDRQILVKNEAFSKQQAPGMSPRLTLIDRSKL